MLCDPGVSPADGLGGVDQKCHDVHVANLGKRALVELGAKRVLRLVQARCIDDDDLAALAIDHGPHAATRSLRDG